MTEKQISEEDLEAAQRAFDDEHDLWDTRRTARGEWWVTRNDEIMLTAYDDLVAEGEMHNMRDDAGVKAVLQALQNRGWRRREDGLEEAAKACDAFADEIMIDRDERNVQIPMWALQEVFDTAQAAVERMPTRNPLRRSQIAMAFDACRDAVRKFEQNDTEEKRDS